MAQPVSFALYDSGTGLPITTATPVFQDYRTRAGVARAAPTISHAGGGIYTFTPTDPDEAIGVAALVYGGLGVAPAYVAFSVSLPADPFACIVLYDNLGALWVGADPTVGIYKDFNGLNRTAPTLLAASGDYLWTLTPTVADLYVGVVYRVDAPVNAYPTYTDGNFALPTTDCGVVTLLELRTRCKQESDNVGQSFISDAEWNGYIASSYQELYGMIVQAFGNDYFVQSPSTGYTFTTDGVNQFYVLPNHFFKLLGVDLQITGTQYVALKPFAFADRNRLSITNSTVPMAGQTIRMFFVPRCCPPVVDADTVDGVNGWEEFIVVDACIKALAKEESDLTAFAARRSALVDRFKSEVENRDASTSGAIVDVFGRRARAMQYRINGNKLWLIGNGMPGWGPWGDWGEDQSYLY